VLELRVHTVPVVEFTIPVRFPFVLLLARCLQLLRPVAAARPQLPQEEVRAQQRPAHQEEAQGAPLGCVAVGSSLYSAAVYGSASPISSSSTCEFLFAVNNELFDDAFLDCSWLRSCIGGASQSVLGSGMRAGMERVRVRRRTQHQCCGCYLSHAAGQHLARGCRLNRAGVTCWRGALGATVIAGALADKHINRSILRTSAAKCHMCAQRLHP